MLSWSFCVTFTDRDLEQVTETSCRAKASHVQTDLPVLPVTRTNVQRRQIDVFQCPYLMSISSAPPFPGVRTHIDRHVLTDIPGRRIFGLFHKIDHQACAAHVTEFMLFVLPSKPVHRKLAFASIKCDILPEWVDIPVAVDLADTAIAFIDVYG